MNQRVFNMTMADIYPLYLAKVERKGQTETDLKTIITWLTGYDQDGLDQVIEEKKTLAEFFAEAPQLNENRNLITGSICGYKVQEITDPLMQNIRYLDKLVDELAKGRAIEKILRA